MIIDLQKQRHGRSNAQRTFVISAAYRSSKDGAWEPWMDTRDVYAVVTANGRIDAIKSYLSKRNDLAQQAQTDWQFNLVPGNGLSQAQRVWLVRDLEDFGTFIKKEDSVALDLGAGIEVQNVLLVF